MKKIFNNKGFSLMEMMVVISITTIGLLGISSLVVQNQRAQSVNKNYIIGSMLAQEGLELIRNIRDNNWLNLSANDWNDDLNSVDNDLTFIIDLEGRAFLNDNPDDLSNDLTKLYIDATNNDFYTHFPDGTNNQETDFRRLITITEDGVGNYIIVNSTVSRPVRGGGIKLYEAETYLYNWH